MSDDNDTVTYEENAVLIDMHRELMQKISILQEDLATQKHRLLNIETILRKTCNHQWAVDYIDQMYPILPIL